MSVAGCGGRRRRRGGCLGERLEALRLAASGGGAEPPVKTEVAMSGQLALGMGEVLVAAAVWETLPPERQRR